MVEPKQPDLKVLLPLSCPLFPPVLLPQSMSLFLYVSSSCISRIVFPYRGQFDLKAVACIAPVSVWDSAREHLNGALGHRICNREQKRGVRKSSLILWPPSSPPPLCPKLIKISTWRWWVTESTSVRQTEPRWDDVSCAWPGHQPLFTAQITISKVNSAMATCKEESPLHSPKKKKEEILSFKKCHPEQHLSMRDKASWRCHHLLVLRGDTVQWFSKSLSRWREWAKGAVPGYAKATWCTQHTARQLASWGRLIKWPGWSDKKEDILGTSKRQMGRRTTQGHAVMPQWQDDSWLLLEDQYALNTSPTPFCSQEAAS